MNYQNIKKEKEAKTSLLIKKCKMFFAFSNKQFEENKTDLKEELKKDRAHRERERTYLKEI